MWVKGLTIVSVDLQWLRARLGRIGIRVPAVRRAPTSASFGWRPAGSRARDRGAALGSAGWNLSFAGRYRLPGPASGAGFLAAVACAPVAHSSAHHGPPAPLPPERAEPLRGTLEVSGVRIYTDRAARARVMVLLTNHGRDELKHLSCRVDLRRAGSQDRTALASFRFELRGALAPNSFREVEAPLELAVPLQAVPKWRELQMHLESCSKQ